MPVWESSHAMSLEVGSYFIGRKAKQKQRYHQTSNTIRTQPEYLNVSRRVLQLYLPNPLKLGVKSRMKLYLKHRMSALPSVQICYYLLKRLILVMYTMDAIQYLNTILTSYCGGWKGYRYIAVLCKNYHFVFAECIGFPISQNNNPKNGYIVYVIYRKQRPQNKKCV